MTVRNQPFKLSQAEGITGVTNSGKDKLGIWGERKKSGVTEAHKMSGEGC